MTDADRIRQLEDALEHAITLIESYQMDLRTRTELQAEGFCQGSVYRNAVPTLMRVLGRGQMYVTLEGEVARI